MNVLRLNFLYQSENNSLEIEQNIFSIVVLFIFVSTSFSLFIFNRYPSKVFVGDTYCYFAGTVLSSVGIILNSPIILLFFFLP